MKNYTNYNPQINDTSVDHDEEVISLDPTGRRNRNSHTGKSPANNKDNRGSDKSGGSKPNPKPVRRSIFSAQTWRDFASNSTLRLILGVILGCFAVYLTASFISYITDVPSVQSTILNTEVGTSGKVNNIGGEGGARLAHILINDTFGLGSLVILFWLYAMTFKMFDSRIRFKTLNFTIKCLVALISVSLIVGLITYATDTPLNLGGLHGRYVTEFMIDFTGTFGAILLCIIAVAIFVGLCLNDFIRWIVKIKRANDKRRAEAAAKKAEEKRKAELIEEMRRKELEEAAAAGEHESKDDESEEAVEKGVIFSTDSALTDSEDLTYELPDDETTHNDEQITGQEGYAEANSFDDNREEANGVAPMEVTRNHIGEIDADAPDSKDNKSLQKPWKFPPFKLLKEYEKVESVDRAEQEENQERIRRTLLDFGIPIVSIKATVGPTVTLYEIVPDKGVKIAKIRNLVDDIALSLAATGVRIIAPIPGKGTVGIEVANRVKQIVSIRSILRSRAFSNNRYKLPIVLGETIGGEVYMADLTKMPHLLVAGATGQGKSVGLNTIITSLLYSLPPSQLKFVMVDPKMVEFSLYSKIQHHYLAKLSDEEEPIITDIKRASATLNSLCVEMDNRYKLLKKAGVRNIEEYNSKFENNTLNPNNGHRFLPYMVVIVDEFSDLIMQAGKEVETPIARLGQKARAVGMHVIIATQRPSTNVITGLIKSNFPARIAFKVASGVDSKTILDTTGAQHLIGRGDMLISSNSELVRVQCALIETEEVQDLCDYISKQPYAPGPYILPEPIMTEDEDGDFGASAAGLNNLDSLFEEVAHYVVQSGTASTSALQRRHSIGYNRAGKIMDQLELAGIVSAPQGGKPRSVLVDEMGLEDILRTLL